MLILTDSVQKAVTRFIEGEEEPADGLRVAVSGDGCSGMQYVMAFEASVKGDDVVLEFGSLKIFVDPASAPLLKGVTIDFVNSMEGSGFKFDNPNATASCGCGNSFIC